MVVCNCITRTTNKIEERFNDDWLAKIFLSTTQLKTGDIWRKQEWGRYALKTRVFCSIQQSWNIWYEHQRKKVMQIRKKLILSCFSKHKKFLKLFSTILLCHFFPLLTLLWFRFRHGATSKLDFNLSFCCSFQKVFQLLYWSCQW